MSRILKAYRIEAEVKGPVFVGSGKEYTKKEYVFLSKDKVGFIDTAQLYQFMKKRSLESQFEDYVLNDTRQDLKQWLSRYNINLQEIKSCIKYSIECGDTVLQRGTKVSVMEGIKDPMGNMYIPGSSIKGMLRTMLLSKDILKNEKKFERLKDSTKYALTKPANRNTYMLKEIKQIETEAFYTLNRKDTKPNNAVNDELSGVIISDSSPIEINNVILCQRVEQHVDGRKKCLNVLRECIKPGTMFEFMITIDETISNLTIEDIKEAIAMFSEVYNENFLSAYRGMDLIQKDNFFLGGGVGFVSKTVVYPLFGKREGIRVTQNIFENTKVPRNHKHHKDMEMGVSPHILKCTNYEGQLLQMGLCKLRKVEQIS